MSLLMCKPLGLEEFDACQKLIAVLHKHVIAHVQACGGTDKKDALLVCRCMG